MLQEKKILPDIPRVTAPFDVDLPFPEIRLKMRIRLILRTLNLMSLSAVRRRDGKLN